MKSILLIGLGRFGKHIALSLNEFHHQVMVVDQNEEKINEIDYSLKSLEDKLYLQTKDKITISETINNYNLELSNLKEKLSNTSIDIKSLEALEKGSLTTEEENIMKEYYEAVKMRDKCLLNV